MEMKFRICEICGNIVGTVKDSGMPVFCCGQEMKNIIPGTADASIEKHVPEITKTGNEVLVRIGQLPHPMSSSHYIEWIAIKTMQGNQRKELMPDMKPEAVFALSKGDEVISAYAYCNLHGLWEKSADKQSG